MGDQDSGFEKTRTQVESEPIGKHDISARILGGYFWGFEKRPTKRLYAGQTIKWNIYIYTIYI